MRRLSIYGLVLFLTLSVGFAQTFPDKIGVGLEGIGGRALEFVDAAKTLRSWEGINGGAVAKDSDGWPLADARTVMFDMRPIPAWAPPLDDPDAYQINVSGRYKLSFTGQAVIQSFGEPMTVSNQKYDPATNTTTADITFAAGKGFLGIGFSQTNGGVKNVKLIRPGYPADTRQIFHTPFLQALEPFKVLRFMDFTATNNNEATFPAVREWADRKLPTHATQSGDLGKQGAAWEYVAELARVTHKDIWINIPVSATEDYIRQLATLMKDRLPSDINIYLEHSNEVWNGLFSQKTYNEQAAYDEIAKGGSNLNNDGVSSSAPVRRHIRRTLRIGQIFSEVFGEPINGRIRPIFSWWILTPTSYSSALEWAKNTYGPPSQFLYGIATTGYINVSGAPTNATPEQLVSAMRSDGDRAVNTWYQFNTIAQSYGLKHCIYEGGSDTGGGSTVNVANRIRAERSAGMRDLLIHHIRDNWFAPGGDLFMYFTLSSAYSRYGCWGLTDDITRLDTPKYQGLLELLGKTTPAFPVRLIFPFYQDTAQGSTSFAVSNYGEQDARLRITAYRESGTLLPAPDIPFYDTLVGHSQMARFGFEIFGTPAGSMQSGWVELESSQPVGSFFQHGVAMPASLDGATASSSAAAKLYFTRLFHGSSAYFGHSAVTTLSVANPGSSPITCAFRLIGSGGGPAIAQSNATIPAKGFHIKSVSDLFGASAVTAGRYVQVEVTEGEGAAGFALVTVEDPVTVIGLNAGVISDATALYSAQLAEISGVLYTSVKLVNTTGQTRVLTLRAINDDGGTLLGPTQVTLLPGAALEKLPSEIFGVAGPSNLIGTLLVTADGTGVIGDVVFGDTAGQYAAALPLQDRPFKRAVFSQVANLPGLLFTGLAVYNPGGNAAGMNIKVFSAEGDLKGQAPLTLAPGRRISNVLDELVPGVQTQVRGYIVIESDQPLFAQQLFGNGTSLLSAVPPTIVE